MPLTVHLRGFLWFPTPSLERLSTILNGLRRDRAQMAPAFLFVDPFGFKILRGCFADLMKAAPAWQA